MWCNFGSDDRLLIAELLEMYGYQITEERITMILYHLEEFFQRQLREEAQHIVETSG